jgi:hypothetical protein
MQYKSCLRNAAAAQKKSGQKYPAAHYFIFAPGARALLQVSQE